MRHKKEIVLPDDWKDRIYDVMSNGGTIAEVCKELGLTVAYHRRCMDENEEYAEAIESGKTYAEAWWARTGRENITNKQMVPAMWIFTMKSRFGWRESGPVDGSKKEQPNEDELLQKYKKREECDGEKGIGIGDGCLVS